MKNVTLERQEDGSYKLVEDQTAELAQEKTSVKDVLASIGFTEDEITRIASGKTEANLESMAAFDKITNIELMGIPVGAAAVGSMMAIIVDRVALAKLDPTNKWGSWANLAAAFVINKYGGKLVGKKTAEMTAFILTYEAVADWVSQGLNKVWPVSGTMQQNFTAKYNALTQAEKVASDYYGTAFRG